MQTALSKVVLPSGFVEVKNDDLFCITYFDLAAIKLHLEGGRLRADFVDDFHFIVITYGNKRRKTRMPKSEEHVERGSGKDRGTCLLQEVVVHLVDHGNLQDGHDAFIYAPCPFGSGQVRMQEFSADLVQPIGHPGSGFFWRLLGVIKKT